MSVARRSSEKTRADDDSNNDSNINQLQQLWQAYLVQLQKRPILTKAITSAIIAALGNLVAQKAVERTKLDPKRLAKFTLIGFIFGPVGHYKYILLEKLFRGVKASATALVYMKLASDQLVCGPLQNVLFFVLLALLNGLSITDTVKNNIVATQLNSWKIWPFASFVIFKYVPPHLRVLFGNLIGFFWSIILTVMSKTKK